MTSSLSLAMRPYSIEARTRKYVKEYGFLSFRKKHEKQLLDKRIYSLKTNRKNVVHQACKVLGDKIVDTVAKSNDDKIVKPHENSRNVEEIIIPPEKKRWNIKQIKKSSIGTLKNI